MQQTQSDLPSVEQHSQAERALRRPAVRCVMLVLAIGAFVLPAQATPLADAAVEPAHASATAPPAAPGTGKLQARLDALQHITVTAQRVPAADVPAASPTVRAVLDDAARAERSASGATTDSPD